MSATAITAPRASTDAARRRRHRVWVVLGAAAAIAATLALAVNGAGYYILGAGDRVLSPHHGQLKPGGTIGTAMGISGTAMILAIFLYPIRKRWKWLSKKGKTKHWLDYHILMGLTAPVVITFHSAFKFRGVAGLAYWSMMAVMASGIVGRYFYGRIPRKLGEAEMSFDEAERLRAALAEQIAEQRVLPREELDSLLALPSKDEVQRMLKLMPRQALHAKTIGFIHPATGKEMHFDSELPSDMKSVLEILRAKNGSGT